jgi:hypothetical protein
LGNVDKLEVLHRQTEIAACAPLQSERSHSREDLPVLTTELKEFIDNAIVPILVKEYLALAVEEIELANAVGRAAHSPQHDGRILAGNVRP